MTEMVLKDGFAEAALAGTDWWRGCVIYQIYPRSFQDSTGNGVGDLAGITQRLAYVADLGVDAIWISPFFPSPMDDFGYDVSDYTNVDPMFGTLKDFDGLIAEADRLGLKVLIDQVLSHTSDQHPWFVESRQDRTNPKANWYVWADPKDDGTPPNNWLSIFGGSAWQWEPRREQYYLHNFLRSQPDLNFHEPAVQDALLEASRFWLDRGVSGFRLDTINFYFADAELRDNPPLPKEKRNANIAPSVNPYNHQEHLYSKNRPENLGFLKRYRALLDEYPGTTIVGEVGDAQRGLEILGEYTAGDDRVHMCYAFEFLSGQCPDAARFAEVFEALEAAAPDGWPCWAFSNHDVVRHASRWNLSPEALRCFLVLLISLRGSVCLYQGEELGLPEAEVAFEDLQDPYGIEFWPEFKGRDGCRTPMVWDPTAPNGGFSSANRTWLPISPMHMESLEAARSASQGSLIDFYRQALALRRTAPALRIGTQSTMIVEGNLLRFTRTGPDGDAIECLFNLGDTSIDVAAEGHSISGALCPAEPGANGQLTLGPWQFCLMAPANKHGEAG